MFTAIVNAAILLGAILVIVFAVVVLAVLALVAYLIYVAARYGNTKPAIKVYRGGW